MFTHIPNNWMVVEFGSVIDGGTRNGIYKQQQFRGSGIKMVNMGELFAYPRLRDVPMSRIQLTDNELQRFRLQVGDLLFARRSLVAEGAGKCSIVYEIKEPLTFESSIIRARPKKGIADSLFLYYLFNSPIGSYLLGTILRQVAVSGITGSDLVKLTIPLPPLSEQRAIAGELDALDEKIELNRRMNRTLEAIARAEFHKLMKQEGGKETTIGEIVTIVGGSTPSTANPDFWEGGDINWATPKDLAPLQSPILKQITKSLKLVYMKSVLAYCQLEQYYFLRVHRLVIWRLIKFQWQSTRVL
jgi:restriction endonuclease S subunit